MTNHPALSRITIAACDEMQDAEEKVRELPQDETAEHAKEIAEKLKSGIAKSYNLYENGVYCGFFIVEKYRDELVVLAMKATKPINIFETLTAEVESLARNANCRSYTFSTIRPGLISQSLKNGFKFSSVVMRKIL